MRILILGGNGMIGHKMYQILGSKFQDTWVLMRQHLGQLSFKKIYDPAMVIDGFDLIEFEKLKALLNTLNPDIIINAAGITIRRGVNERVYKSILVNSALPHFLEEWVSGKEGKRLIHFSTDCVFSGKGGAYTEDSLLDANDVYGKTKGLGEVSGPQSLTLRGSMIGRELDYHTELLEWFLSQKENTIKGFSNVIYSGITNVKMAEFVREIIVHFPSLSGIYNVSSVPISKYDLLVLFKNTFEYEVDIQEEKGYISRKDLIPDKFYTATGFSVPVWKDLARELKEDSQLYSAYYKN